MLLKIKTLLFLAVLAGSDSSPDLMEMMMAEQNFQEEANLVHEKMDAMLSDPRTLVQAKCIAKQMEALMAVPNVQEQVKVFAEQTEANFQEQAAKMVIPNVETLQAGSPNSQVQVKMFAEQMKEMLTKSVTKQMEAMSADPSVQEQAKMFAQQMQTSRCNTVDKMFDRRLQTSPLEHASLENTVLAKPSSVAIQPGMGVNSFITPPSIRPSSLRSPPASAIRGAKFAERVSTVRASTLFPRRKAPNKAEIQKAQRDKRNQRGRSAPEPEEQDEFLSPELEENLKEAAYLFMRLAVASVMIHHGQEKILSAEAFTKFAIDKYFAFLPGPHIFWAYSAGAVQGIGPIMLTLGVFSRLAAASMAGTMVAATYYSVITTGLEGFPLSKMAGRVPIFHNYGFETPVLYLGIFLFVVAAGPGKFSLAQLLGWNDDKSLFGKIKQ